MGRPQRPYLHRGCNHISDIDHVDLGRGLIYYLKFKERQHRKQSVFRLWARWERSGSRKRVADRKSGRPAARAEVRDLLTAAGINVVLTRTADESVSINDRCKIANAAKCDYFLSIHRNAATPDAVGNEIWVHSQAVAHVVDKAQKNPERGMCGCREEPGRKERRGGELHGLRCEPGYGYAVRLLELGFITSDTDNKYFDTHFDAYAKAIAKGVCAALGVDYKDPQPAPTKPSLAAALVLSL